MSTCRSVLENFAAISVVDEEEPNEFSCQNVFDSCCHPDDLEPLSVDTRN